MIESEWVVMGIATMFGLAVIWSGITDNAFAFKLWLPRLLESKLGRPRARLVLVLLGAVVISIGGFVAWNATRSKFTPESPAQNIKE